MWKKASSPCVLLTIVAAFVVLVVIKITCLLEASARAHNLARRVAQPESPTPDAGEVTADALAVAEQLKKHNLFSPPQPPRHPVSSVLGILGDEALIGNRWYKAGDNIADAEIVCVEPTHVRIRWQGRETVLAPIQIPEQTSTSGSRTALGSLRQASQGRILAAGSPATVRSGLADRNRVGRSTKVPAENKTNRNAKADKKQRALTKNQQYQEPLKQDLKSLKNERAIRKKNTTDAGAAKKATATDIKQLRRRPAR